MEASSFTPLIDVEPSSTPAKASARISWRGVTAALLWVFSVFSVSTVAVSFQAFGSSHSSFFAARLTEVPTLSNGTFGAYSNTAPRSCAGQLDGLTWIRPDGDRAMQVFCEGGWVLVQKRTSSSVNFDRGWTSYRRGFGDETNFWLGNDNLHAMTMSGARLRVVLTDADNNVRYAEYRKFSVAGEDENFRVVFDDYSGNATDALTYHSGNSFSTWDADHDRWSGNCAENCLGGWWYDACLQANLNGLYEGPGPVATTSSVIGIVWNTWKGDWYSMGSTYMWVQPNE